jgi:hypothetical protein
MLRDGLPCPRDERFHAGGLADIQCMEMGFGRASLAGFIGDFFEAIHASGAEQEVGAFGAESPRGGGPESTGSPGDHNPLVLQCRSIHD